MAYTLIFQILEPESKMATIDIFIRLEDEQLDEMIGMSMICLWHRLVEF